MAKSIRSKWKRKCRAVKRERYAVKELVRLKKTLGIENDANKMSTAEIIEKTEDQVIFFDAAQIKEKSNKKEIEEEEQEDAEMSSDEEAVAIKDDKGRKKVFNSKTMKDENGHYPVWLHKRKIAKMTKTVKKRKSKGKKQRRK